MKKTLSLLLVVMMLVQICGSTAAETEKRTYTVIYTDQNGVQHEVQVTDALQAYELGQYTVDGDIVSVYNGINTTGNNKISVDGSIMAGNEYETDSWGYDENGQYVEVKKVSGAGDGISATGNVSVAVKGDVEAKGNGINVYDSYVYDADTGTYQSISSESKVTVDGSVTSEYGYGIQSAGDNMIVVKGDLAGLYYGAYITDTDLIVDGNITARDATQYPIFTYDEEGNSVLTGWRMSGNSTGLMVYGDSKVDVGGDINAAGNAISSYNNQVWKSDTDTWEMKENNAEIKVKGDIKSQYQTGIYAEGNAKINASGDIEAYGTGVLASNHANVNVEGDINAGHTYETEKWGYNENGQYVNLGMQETGTGTGITASGNAKVDVGGDIDSKGNGIQTNVQSEYDSETGTWIEKTNAVEITVNGSVNAEYGNGVNVTGAKVKVEGDINAGENGISAIESNITVAGSVSAYENGAIAKGDSLIEIGGGITAGHTFKTNQWGYNEKAEYEVVGTQVTGAGIGISGSGNAKVIVDGNIESKGNGISISPRSEYDAETGTWIDLPNAVEIIVNGSVTSECGEGVNVTGANVMIKNDVNAALSGVSANGDSNVEIGGKITVGHTYITGQWGYNEKDQYVFLGMQETGTGIGVYASGNANVAVSGNIESKGNGIETGINRKYDSANTWIDETNTVEIAVDGSIDAEYGIGVAVTGAKVEIQGDVNAGQDTILAADSDVFVGGNIVSERYNGITASGKTNVNVAGNVDTYRTGVSATGNSIIEIGGKINAGHTYQTEQWGYDKNGTYGIIGMNDVGTGTGVIVSDNATVTVNGNVESKGDGVVIQNRTEYDNESQTWVTIPNSAKVTVNGSVNSEYGSGVHASGADVTVQGGIEARMTGIYAVGSDVSVGGDVVSGYVTKTDVYDKDGAYLFTDQWGIGHGIQTGDDGNVTVEGNVRSAGKGIYGYGNVAVKGGLTSEYSLGIEGCGNSYITLGGGINAYSSGVEVYDQAQVTVGGDINAGHLQPYYDYWIEENGEEYINSGTYYDGFGIRTEGNTFVEVNGDVNAAESGIISLNMLDSSYDYVEHEDGSFEDIFHEFVLEEDTSTVTVHGDVNALSAAGINAEGQACITIDGNVTGTNGMELRDEVTVDVAGDVKATDGIGILAVENIQNEIVHNLYEYENEEDEFPNVTVWYENQIPTINQTTVHVGGDVSGAEYGIRANGNAAITVDGNVYADGDSGIQVGEYWVYDDGTVCGDTNVNIAIAGNVEAQANGVVLEGNGTIDIGGDVIADTMSGILMRESANDAIVTIGGDVNGGSFEWPVDPDIETEEWIEEEELPEPIEIERDELQERIDALFDDVTVEVAEVNLGAVMLEDNQTLENDKPAAGQIVIQGSINAQGGTDAYVVDLYVNENDIGNTIVPDIPTLTVFEMNTVDGDYVDVNVSEVATREMDGVEYTRTFVTGLEEQRKTELVDAIAATIQYIIKVTQPENGSIEMSGATYDELSEQMVAHEGDDLSLTVHVDRGYYLDTMAAGTKATVVNNGDGTWTVTVERGGGVSISANIVLCRHTWNILGQKQATCTEDGYLDRVCQLCGLHEDTIRPAHGHDFPDIFEDNHNGTHSAECLNGCGEILTLPCEMDIVEGLGIRTGICKACGYSFTEKVELDADAIAEKVAQAAEIENAITNVDVIMNIANALVAKLNPDDENVKVISVAVEDAEYEIIEPETEDESAEALPPLVGTLFVNQQTMVSAESLKNGNIEQVGEPLLIYNISLVHQGQAVNLDRMIRITFPVTEDIIKALENKALVLMTEEGYMIEIPYEIIDGMIVFETSRLGMFAFVDRTMLEQTTKTNEQY